jgi:ribosomal-protein-alanine N-acetyltransferase
MNALLEPDPGPRPMILRDLDAVLAIEARCYGFPWTRGNFIDSLAAGYVAEVLPAPRGGLIGYFVALAGADEMHLLNLSVAPEHQQRGHASVLLDRLDALCREQQLGSLWLEVRVSNQRARAIYLRRGFAEVGLRRDYYPAAQGQREHAVLMSRRIAPPGDALD